jgi:phosphate transport system permease protein
MSDTTLTAVPTIGSRTPAFEARLKKRYAAERRFRFYGLAAIWFSFFFLIVLFVTIIGRGWTSFMQASFALDVTFAQEVIDPSGMHDHSALLTADYQKLARDALYAKLGLDASKRPERKDAAALLSRGVDVELRQMVLDDPAIIGQARTVDLIAAGNVDALLKGTIDRATPEANRQVNNRQVAWIDKLYSEGVLARHFNWGLFTHGASSQPETAGLAVALVGSFFMMLTVILLAVPLGVAGAIYLEEFAPKNRWTDVIEVNINNLAAVPSIVFGLLGLAIFINTLGLPRSASLVGGLVLTLMTLPTIIIATRAAITAVPPSIREAAYGVGASKMQTVFHHVLPLAVPGILTGTIIGLVRALGETAPLLMIGMVAFIVAPPTTPLEPATALPIQIYMWATAAERGFYERTAGATIVLLLFSFVMNAAAIYLRRKFERRW